MDNGRIMKELKELQEASKNVLHLIIYLFINLNQSAVPTVQAKLVGDNLRHWKGTIFGPVILT